MSAVANSWAMAHGADGAIHASRVRRRRVQRAGADRAGDVHVGQGGEGVIKRQICRLIGRLERAAFFI